jgi:hypothetical protein
MTTMAVDSSECKRMNLEQTLLEERSVVEIIPSRQACRFSLEHERARQHVN